MTCYEQNKIMGAVKLYKYLDFNGGLMMLHYGNFQFTNVTQLNDPFDCHPSLIDFSNVPKEACEGWIPEIIEKLRRESFRRNREEVWICSLSKIYDSILMWSYYSKHKGQAWEHEQEVRLFILDPWPTSYMSLLPGQNDDR